MGAIERKGFGLNPKVSVLSPQNEQVMVVSKIKDSQLPYGEIRVDGRDLKIVMEKGASEDGAGGEPLIFQIDVDSKTKHETYYSVALGDFKDLNSTYSIHTSPAVQYSPGLKITVLACLLYIKNIYCR